jgi:hypothetical protein
LLEAGRPAEAARAIKRSIEWHERARSSLVTTEDRSRYQTRWQESYVHLATALARANRPEEAFRVVDLGRARGLRERFGRTLPAANLEVPAALRSEAARVQKALEEAQRDLVAAYAHGSARPARELASLERRCRELRETAAGVALRIERRAPAYAGEAGLARPMEVSEVQRRLRRGDVFLLYVVGKARTLRFTVTARTLEVRELAPGEAELSRRVDALMAAIESGGASWLSEAATLADVLLPVKPLGPGRLFVSADGPLHRLPFEVLRPGTASERSTLVEQHSVVYGPSATLLFTPGTPGTAGPGSLAVFGDPEVSDEPAQERRGDAPLPAFAVGPLPHARREAQGIAARFPDARLYFGADATEARALEEIGRSDMVHIAAHAFADPENPRFSGLVLARSPKSGDGLLQAYEIAARRGRLSLVTLSACESGRGPVQRGEGMLGLARAFRVAGARALVASLWKVDDGATADFMLAFYDRLARGESRAEALAAVKRAWIGISDAAPVAPGESRGVARLPLAEFHRHPRHWAAFVLHGTAAP